MFWGVGDSVEGRKAKGLGLRDPTQLLTFGSDRTHSYENRRTSVSFRDLSRSFPYPLFPLPIHRAGGEE